MSHTANYYYCYRNPLNSRTTRLIGAFLLANCFVITVVRIANSSSKQTSSPGDPVALSLLSSSSGADPVNLRHQPASSTSSSNNHRRYHEDAKLILFWTPWFGDTSWSSVFQYNNGPLIELDDGTERHCLLTTDRRLEDAADAIMFHGRDYDNKDEPPAHRPDQRWVFFSLEPPSLTFMEGTWSGLTNGSVFNWTVSYSAKADIRFPYGRLLSKPAQTAADLNKTADKIAEFVANFSRRKRDAVWIVSNCDTTSQREKVVKRLQELGVTVDIYGQCGKKAPPWDPENAAFFSDYRYYFALENSICDDYVSEKLFRGLSLSANFGVIPLSYHGNIDYKTLGVPTDSFIDIRHFLPNNLTGLVKYLKQTLKTDPLQLTDLYSWQFTHKVDPFSFAFKWRKLCAALWDEKQPDTSVVQDIRETYGNCYNPSENQIN